MSENNNRKNNKNKNKKKKKNGFLLTIKILLILFILTGFIAVGVVGGLVVVTLKDVEPIDPSNIEQLLDENSVILDQNGNVIEKIQRSGLRTIVKYEEVDEDLKNAFLATEDRKFFEHHGFNYKRLVGAVIQAIKNKTFSPRGTSTITQQLARNLYLPHIKSERTITRKIKEAYYAVQLEKHLLKEQIFEAYMNTIYLGSGAKGVQAAAQVYFSKDAKDLDLVESALIAGITQNPAHHSPIKTVKKENVDEDDYIIDDSGEIYTVVFNENSLDRFQDVLYFMKQTGKISEAEYEEASSVDLKTKLNPGKHKNNEISSYFSDLVKDEVVNSLMTELDISQEDAYNMLYTQGLKIYTTLDLDMQTKLEKMYQEDSNFPGLVIRKDNAGNILSKNKSILLYKKDNLVTADNHLKIASGEYEYLPDGNLLLKKNRRLKFISLYEDKKVVGIKVAVEDTYGYNDNKQLLIFKGGSVKIPAEFKSFDNNKNLIVDKAFLNSNPNFFKKDGNGNLLIASSNYDISSKGSVQPQSSMVIMDYTNGEIKALVGGRDIKGQMVYNRAINPRQPGSSIKPLGVYAPALDNGWTAASIIDDVPYYNNGKRWPRNWYEKWRDPKHTGYWGLTTVREALKWSMNVPAVKVAERIGVSTSIDYLERMGITTLVKKGPRTDMNLPAVALGGMTHGLTPLEATAAYGSIANKGIYIKPHSFTKVTDRKGNVIIEHKPVKNFVVSPQVAFIVTDMLKSGVETGTGTRARISNMPVAGKTGTTSNNYDAWFVGYTPYYVASVWIGNDLQIQLESGSRVSAILWQKVMSEIHKDLPSKNFEVPDGVIRRAVDVRSGKLPTDLSSRDPELGRGSVISEYFVQGTEPTDYDDVHVEVEVCTESNKLPTGYCPTNLIEKKVFISRPVPYNPEDHNGFVPDDYQYEAPTEYCDIHTGESSQPKPMEDLPPGAITLPNGSVVLPDGRKILPNGTIIFPNGSVVFPSPNNEDDSDTSQGGENDSNMVDENTNDLIDSDDNIIDSNSN